MKRAGTQWMALCLVLAAAPAWAQIAELENPGTATAVQDRLYRMSHELNLSLGVLPLDAFYKGLIGQVGYTFHFSDSFAWQVGRGTYSYNLATGLREQLTRQFGVEPTAFDEVNWMVGSDLIWSPLYGKVAVLNRWVQHFGVSLIGGLSVLRLTLADGGAAGPLPVALFGSFRPALNLGLSIRLFNSKLVSFRLDVTDNLVVSDRVFQVMTIQLGASMNFGATE